MFCLECQVDISYRFQFHMFNSHIQVDIQALAHAVELTRQGAIDSLRFAKGDLLQAFQVISCSLVYSIILSIKHF